MDQVRRDKESLETQLKHLQQSGPPQAVDETSRIDVYATYLEMILKSQEESKVNPNQVQVPSKLSEFQLSSSKVCQLYKYNIINTI